MNIMSKLKLTLEENIIDYIKKCLCELVIEKHGTNLKHAVINLYQAIELALKQRLRYFDENSIYTNDKNRKTLDLKESIRKLESFGVIIDEKYKNSIYTLRDIRNEYTHLESNHNVRTLSILLSNCIEFLDIFLRNELNIEIKEIAKRTMVIFI